MFHNAGQKPFLVCARLSDGLDQEQIRVSQEGKDTYEKAEARQCSQRKEKRQKK